MSRVPLTDAEKASLEFTIGIYASLVADLKDAVENGWPTHEELELIDAPRFKDWMFSERRVPNIEGRVRHHPILNDGWIKSSPLHAFSAAAAVARTESRWYRLGNQVVEFVEDTDETIIPTWEIR